MAAGAVDRGVGEASTFLASAAGARTGKASWVLRYRLHGRNKGEGARALSRAVAGRTLANWPDVIERRSSVASTQPKASRKGPGAQKLPR